MNKSKIEWCDSTWNPVTGCLHGCTYCYAEKIAKRFGNHWKSTALIEYLDEPYRENGIVQPYQFDFKPTFHRYRLGEPTKKTKPQNIFVCSMADLFGEWVPDEWIEQVFEACKAAPQHRFLFLTKNLSGVKYPFHLFFQRNRNTWIGTSLTGKSDLKKAEKLYLETTASTNRFLSIEPLLNDIGLLPLEVYKWVIVGAQTGPGAKQPEPEWVQSIIDQCRDAGIPIFLKNNLNWPMRIQEYPWDIFNMKESD